MRALNVLLEVSDQELATMTMLSGAEPFNSAIALTGVADLEETAV